MRPCQRGDAPETLLRHGPEIARNYAEKRRSNSAHRFRWPHRDGQPLLTVVRAALSAMTDGHCAYCDGFPLNTTSEEQVDHFRPASREEFYQLVATWENLFLACHACNKKKLAHWDEALLRPDEPGFTFERFFQYEPETGKLIPAEGAPAEDQHRAETTIRIFRLNRGGIPEARKEMVRRIFDSDADDNLATIAYRYLIPLCR